MRYNALLIAQLFRENGCSIRKVKFAYFSVHCSVLMRVLFSSGILQLLSSHWSPFDARWELWLHALRMR